jgi:hypothetical protein
MNCDDGEVVVTRVFRIGQAPKTIMVDGVLATRSIKDEHKFFPPTKGWPMTCFASGVNANQAGELRDHLLKAGVPTEVTADGDPVYRSAAHRKKALKARGMHDRKSFC